MGTRWCSEANFGNLLIFVEFCWILWANFDILIHSESIYDGTTSDPVCSHGERWKCISSAYSPLIIHHSSSVLKKIHILCTTCSGNTCYLKIFVCMLAMFFSKLGVASQRIFQPSRYKHINKQTHSTSNTRVAQHDFFHFGHKMTWPSGGDWGGKTIHRMGKKQHPGAWISETNWSQQTSHRMLKPLIPQRCFNTLTWYWTFLWWFCHWKWGFPRSMMRYTTRNLIVALSGVSWWTMDLQNRWSYAEVWSDAAGISESAWTWQIYQGGEVWVLFHVWSKSELGKFVLVIPSYPYWEMVINQ